MAIDKMGAGYETEKIPLGVSVVEIPATIRRVYEVALVCANRAVRPVQLGGREVSSVKLAGRVEFLRPYLAPFEVIANIVHYQRLRPVDGSIRTLADRHIWEWDRGTIACRTAESTIRAVEGLSPLLLGSRGILPLWISMVGHTFLIAAQACRLGGGMEKSLSLNADRNTEQNTEQKGLIEARYRIEKMHNIFRACSLFALISAVAVGGRIPMAVYITSGAGDVLAGQFSQRADQRIRGQA